MIVKIEIIDGLPCMVLDEGIILHKEDLKRESSKLIMPEFFTEIQEFKEKHYYDKVLDEIKKKFGEK